MTHAVHRRFIVPEIIQTSAMDCGPACLKSLLEGFGIRVSYGRLREACQTDLDGTSIDAIEEAAVQLGLDAEQVILPADHVLLDAAKGLPAIAVVRLTNGVTHFVVIWRWHGSFVQVMDPGLGRRWISSKQLVEELYIHTQSVSAAEWRQWAGSEEFRRALHRRMTGIGISRIEANRLIARTLSDPGWRAIATLDAAVRTATLLRERRLVESLLARPDLIQQSSWMVAPDASEPGSEPRLRMRGAVLLRARGRRQPSPDELPGAPISPELAASLQEPLTRPARELLRLLGKDGVLAPVTLATGLAAAAAGVVVEAILIRSIVDLGGELGLVGQRFSAAAALLGFSAALLLLEWPMAVSTLRYGRHLELRLRTAFLEKIPRLHDRYFQSRLTSDMAERCHRIQNIRRLPKLGSQLLRTVFELILTTAGIIWLEPASWPLAVSAASVALLLPVFTEPVLSERDLRVRSHAGALTRFYIDALLGLMAVRAHGAARALRRQHETLLVEWARAGYRLQKSAAWVEGLQLLSGYGLAAWLLMDHLSRARESGSALLLIYWALNLPLIGQEIAQAAWQYPSYRNLTLRALEPLGAPEEEPARTSAIVTSEACAQGIAISFQEVSVRAGGHTILKDINACLLPGEHVAVVGPSGAGKSSLVGVLLGWHRAVSGTVLLDGMPLEPSAMDAWRRQIAWVDPAVQLWNKSFAANLIYGTDGTLSMPPGEVIEIADLQRVLEMLPDGLQTQLGEGGASISGGEGQRVRLARAMLRPGVRLVILDEPFRGLDREKRSELLSRARRLWSRATLLCITHDVGETKSFARVLVIERGRLVEDGSPTELAANESSRYRALLEAETAVVRDLWSGVQWRRMQLTDKQVEEQPRTEGTAA